MAYSNEGRMSKGFEAYGRCRAFWCLTSAYVADMIGPIEFAHRAYPFWEYETENGTYQPSPDSEPRG